MTTERTDLYTQVTNAILAELEKGVVPWVQPWQSRSSPLRPLRTNHEPYRGINILLLWMAAEKRGYSSPYWLTFQQARKLGGHIRQGEKSTVIVYADTFTKREHNEHGEEEDRDIPFLKRYSVFNLSQVAGVTSHFPEPDELGEQAITLRANERREDIDRFVSNTGAEVRHGVEAAYYSPSEDCIYMPDLARFENTQSYYAIVMHELVHFTNAPERSPRSFKASRFGTTAYAREELVAELGAAFLCADLGISMTPRPEHASYLSNWLTVLRNDKRAIFQAAAMAQKAADFLHAMQVQHPALEIITK